MNLCDDVSPAMAKRWVFPNKARAEQYFPLQSWLFGCSRQKNDSNYEGNVQS